MHRKAILPSAEVLAPQNHGLKRKRQEPDCYPSQPSEPQTEVLIQRATESDWCTYMGAGTNLTDPPFYNLLRCITSSSSKHDTYAYAYGQIDGIVQKDMDTFEKRVWERDAEQAIVMEIHDQVRHYKGQLTTYMNLTAIAYGPGTGMKAFVSLSSEAAREIGRSIDCRVEPSIVRYRCPDDSPYEVKISGSDVNISQLDEFCKALVKAAAIFNFNAIGTRSELKTTGAKMLVSGISEEDAHQLILDRCTVLSSNVVISKNIFL